ncbi:hypothetical protein N0V82_000589 [Gnomoniopsis sp. IMI 355080]|nr:hypothetical protein N0V82_000589 [Gnomoniopsis sp. IMI 355080]
MRWRQCSLHEAEDREWLGKGVGEITVLEIGGQRSFGIEASRDSERGGNFSPKMAQLPDIVNDLHTSTGSFAALNNRDSDDDDSISPSSSPQRSALIAHSRNPRFPLSPVHEDRIVKSQPRQAYFCMDFPEKLRQRIAKTIHSLEALAKSPLFMDTLIIDEIINFYRDAIKVHRTQMLAMSDDDTNSTETSIKLEELAAHWRTILRDIHNIQTHIHHLQEIAALRTAQRPQQRRARTTPNAHPHKSNNPYQHTRQQSSEVLGPQSAEIFKLQHSTCEFWARCVNMYLERTTDRIRNSSFLSTVFFSPDGLLLAITHWWWIFVTLIVPLTFIIIHLWFETLANNTAFLRRRKMERRQQQQQQQLDGLEEEDMD